MEELISVIVPIYKVENYLEKCVNSIINQTYKNLEIILVDDGSPDNCPKICDTLAKKDKRIKVIHKKNGGLSDARNVGIESATGRYIGFVDSDDYIEPTMYSELISNLKETDSDLSICGRYINYENGKQVQNVTRSIKIEMERNDALIKLNSFSYFDMSACDKLYKAKMIKKIRFPFGKKCEDYYFMYQVFFKCKKIVYFSNPLYHYYQREGSITRNIQMDTAFIDASESQLEFFKKNIPELIYVGKTAYAFANIATYNKYIKYGVNCPTEEIKKFKINVYKNLKYVIKNSNISKTKKLQAVLFLINIKIYSAIIRKKQSLSN